jgi:hypothetical protein
VVGSAGYGACIGVAFTACTRVAPDSGIDQAQDFGRSRPRHLSERRVVAAGEYTGGDRVRERTILRARRPRSPPSPDECYVAILMWRQATVLPGYTCRYGGNPAEAPPTRQPLSAGRPRRDTVPSSPGRPAEPHCFFDCAACSSSSSKSVTRFRIASSARAKSSLKGGTSSQRISFPRGSGNPDRSQPIEITTSADSKAFEVTLRGVVSGTA